ncbi:MAG: hypothetical protein K9G40_06985 [Crocinitomicaceae bacterium]|nr:hypothetical protein [Crocinitomicaceae bacterium]MCF8434517.1 hypothetical protein [Crocinitomicaceae bacterium]
MSEQIEQKPTSSTLVVLCILTLFGSLFILLKGLISYFILEDSNATRSEEGVLFINLVYLIEFLSCIGAIAGAIIMLIGKKIGLVIYVISSILYILLTAAFSVFCFFSLIGIPVGLLQFLYLLPSILFLILYINQAEYLR